MMTDSFIKIWAVHEYQMILCSVWAAKYPLLCFCLNMDYFVYACVALSDPAMIHMGLRGCHTPLALAATFPGQNKANSACHFSSLCMHKSLYQGCVIQGSLFCESMQQTLGKSYLTDLFPPQKTSKQELRQKQTREVTSARPNANETDLFSASR